MEWHARHHNETIDKYQPNKLQFASMQQIGRVISEISAKALPSFRQPAANLGGASLNHSAATKLPGSNYAS
jgi:hypothetical protein